MAKTAKVAPVAAAVAPTAPVAQPNPAGVPFVRNGVYFDRFGNPISRNRHIEGDPIWDVQAPPNVSYQWIRITVRGNPDFSEYSKMRRAGWSAVPHARHADLFRPTNDVALSPDACILHEGQLLVERPLGMTMEAMADHNASVNKTLRDTLNSNNRLTLPDGVMGIDTARNPHVRANTFIGQGMTKGGVVDHNDTVVINHEPKYEPAIDE